VPLAEIDRRWSMDRRAAYGDGAKGGAVANMA